LAGIVVAAVLLVVVVAVAVAVAVTMSNGRDNCGAEKDRVNECSDRWLGDDRAEKCYSCTTERAKQRSDICSSCLELGDAVCSARRFVQLRSLSAKPCKLRNDRRRQGDGGVFLSISRDGRNACTT